MRDGKHVTYAGLASWVEGLAPGGHPEGQVRFSFVLVKEVRASIGAELTRRDR
jgi:hypothetical protein